MKKMKLTVFLLLVGLISPTHLLAEANDETNLIKLTENEVSSIQVFRLKGTDDSRIFRMTDGYDERIIRRVINWINTSSPSEQANELEGGKVPLLLKINMINGDLITLEPAYNCKGGLIKTCTAVDGEIVLTKNKKKIRLTSLELYDWIIVGWKYEPVGPPKEELLEETLYTRYFSVIEKEFPDFIMCPRIDRIERINGDTRRHLVISSALNYAGHHAPSYDRIIFTLIDTPENGIKIIKVRKKSNVSERESQKQCRW
ncbi:hypothetical protein MUG84_26915 [Paenibacillus sp. KQZ6P-2]|uniref:Uncharacterized protein n=1 Tax=Paenibacillus mangrovi TaxID=2931978 RepID=A0A9X2B7S4_9BACL|nr:hypothetical protein [Paenibacillus mangrovi]MCJ8015302.1 hypothetical protein [Paenibacillus mangrovi]